MAKIITTKTHTSGIALGGIGSGSVELWPDGDFHYWLVANQPRITTSCCEKKVDDGEGSAGALSFWVRESKAEGGCIVRKLSMKTDAEDFTYRMFAWNKPVEKIEFDGRFPVCDINYADSALECNLKLKAVSPFVPHNSDVSATPGFYMDFLVENPTDRELEISLMGALEPNFANKNEGNKNNITPTQALSELSERCDLNFGIPKSITARLLTFTRQTICYTRLRNTQLSSSFSSAREWKLFTPTVNRYNRFTFSLSNPWFRPLFSVFNTLFHKYPS